MHAPLDGMPSSCLAIHTSGTQGGTTRAHKEVILYSGTYEGTSGSHSGTVAHKEVLLILGHTIGNYWATKWYSGAHGGTWGTHSAPVHYAAIVAIRE